MPETPEVQEGAAVLIAYTFLSTSGAAINISTASAVTLYLKKPSDGALVTISSASGASFNADGTDGVAAYTTTSKSSTQDGDIDEPGLWSGQYEINATAYVGRGTVFTFRVRGGLVA
jgi:hypothetical protein